ncbi:MAG: hypothetical protein F6K47_28045 [Symploca sp. SIO2E6]|nr:hypothetical protein [Symploca sp. SIO2E6]
MPLNCDPIGEQVASTTSTLAAWKNLAPGKTNMVTADAADTFDEKDNRTTIGNNLQDAPDHSLLEDAPTSVVTQEDTSEIAQYFDNDEDLRKAVLEWKNLLGLSSL